MTPEKKQPIRIELTPEQKEQIRQAIGKEVSALELAVEELEERVSPGGLLSGSSIVGIGPGSDVNLPSSPLLDVKIIVDSQK